MCVCFQQHPIGGAKFTEDDPPNFEGSFYSLTKGIAEKVSITRSCEGVALVLTSLLGVRRLCD